MLSLMSLKIFGEQLIRLTQKFNIPQGYQAIQLLQDRLTEKQTLQQAESKIVPFYLLKRKKT